MHLSLAPTAAQRFEKFHADNPRVYAALVSLAHQWVRATGSRKIGINALFERARWELAVETNDPEFRLNNNWAPWYSRLIAIQEDDLRDVFELRPSGADDWALDLIAQREAG